MKSEKQIEALTDGWRLRASDTDPWMNVPRMPMQVHDVLVHHGQIAPPVDLGKQEPCLWVANKTWVYQTRFTPLEGDGRQFLHFRGLDTVVDVWLNGKKTAAYNDCYYPHRLDITDSLKDENELELRFTGPSCAETKENLETEDQQESLSKRGPGGHSFNGAHPNFETVGVFDSITLERVEVAELDWLDLQVNVTPDGSKGEVVVKPHINNLSDEDVETEVRLYDPDGAACDSLTVERPSLWNPAGYGTQSLYRLEVILKSGDRVLDVANRTIGFRHVERLAEFDYKINGKHVKLWGANFTPMATGTLVWDHAKAERLLDHAVACNISSLRLWGPGLPWDEHLIEEADKRGLLLWFEFSHSGPNQPDNQTFRDMCRREAEYYLKHWKHHPSILLWCGGNETYLGIHKINNPDKKVVGGKVFTETYREVCKQYDPEREYVVNSPYGGPYGNCTFEGDVHVRSYDWCQPGLDFPKLPSEHIRATIPLKKTLQKYFGKDLQWPQGHTGRRTEFNDPFLPESWECAMLWDKRSSINCRLGAIRDFFDPDGTPESLLFVMGAGTSRYIRQTIERYRRGKPSNDDEGQRRVMGHYWWKFNDTFPMIYASLVDDMDEPNMAYYAMRRAYKPLLLSIEVADSVNLWVVNDTGEPVGGTLSVSIYDMRGEKELHRKETDVSIAQGESKIVGNCDDFGMFYTRNPILAELHDKNGQSLASSIEYPCADVQNWFSESTITMRQDGDELLLTTDMPIRWVELEGDADGDAFGWYFEDNFFDLLPGRPKRVRILGKHDKGTVTARSPYSPHTAKVEWKR